MHGLKVYRYNDLRCAVSCALLTVAVLAIASPLSAQTQQVPLDRGWRFRAVASADHPETKTITEPEPGTIHYQLKPRP